MKVILLACAVVLGFALDTCAQTLPPTDARNLQEVREQRVLNLEAIEKAVTPSSRFDAETERAELDGWLMKHPAVFPLLHASKRAPAGNGRQYILDFYQRNNSFSPADQVQFLYGFGEQKRKGLSADLFALLFPGGLRVALGSSVTAGETGDSSRPTPEVALQRVRDGGDMYITGAYPLLAKHTSAFSVSAFFVPRLNFILQGFGGTDVLTESNEHAVDLGGELYVDFKDLEGLGKAFIFYREGWQRLTPAFAQAAGLNGNKFRVAQFAVGMVFSDLVRVSGQRFSAPPMAAEGPAAPSSGWHLVVQLTPQTKR